MTKLTKSKIKIRYTSAARLLCLNTELILDIIRIAKSLVSNGLPLSDCTLLIKNGCRDASLLNGG